jgi:hypothetical protein
MSKSGAALLITVVAAAATACSSGSTPIKVPLTPVPAPIHRPVASAALAAHLIHSSDLGPSWYEGFTPPVTVITTPPLATSVSDGTVTSAPPSDATDGASTALSQMHRLPTTWVFDAQVGEFSFSFPSPSAARHYIREWIAANPGGRHAGFGVGRTAYLLFIDANRAANVQPLSPSRATILAIAKRRARTGA